MADDVDPLSLGGGDSPWAHDVPISAPSPLPDAWSTHTVRPPDPPVPEPSAGPRPPSMHVGQPPPDPDPAPLPPSHGRRRAALIVGLVGLLGAAALGSQFVGGNDDRGDADVTSESAPTTDDASPTTTEDDGPTTITPRLRTRTSTTLGDELPEPIPQWENAAIALGPRIQAIAAPTELVALTAAGRLLVVDLPTGAVRSIDTSDRGIDTMLAVGEHDVVLSSYNRPDATLARPGEPLVRVDIDGGVSQVIARPGTDEFVLIPNMWNPLSPYVLRLGSDAHASGVYDGPLVDFNPWELRFLPATGQMIVTETGGVYIVEEDGSATRVSTGELIAVGANHYVVRECDETLACGYLRVDQRTGERQPIDLSALDRFRDYADVASNALSPDGTALSYFDWTDDNGSPSRRLIDLATGDNVEVAPTDQYNNGPAWAADGSGLFVLDGRSISFFDRATGELVRVAPDTVLDEDIVALAARPISD